MAKGHGGGLLGRPLSLTFGADTGRAAQSRGVPAAGNRFPLSSSQNLALSADPENKEAELRPAVQGIAVAPLEFSRDICVTTSSAKSKICAGKSIGSTLSKAHLVIDGDRS